MSESKKDEIRTLERDIEASKLLNNASSIYEKNSPLYQRNLKLTPNYPNFLKNDINKGRNMRRDNSHIFHDRLKKIKHKSNHLKTNAIIFLSPENERLMDLNQDKEEQKNILNKQILNAEKELTQQDNFISILIIILVIVFLLTLEYYLYLLKIIDSKTNWWIMFITFITGLIYILYIIFNDPTNTITQKIANSTAKTLREYEIMLGLINNKSNC